MISAAANNRTRRLAVAPDRLVIVSSDRHERLYDLFRRACELPVDERRAFVEHECRDDASLRVELERLLTHDAGEESLASAARSPIGDGASSLPQVIGGRVVGQYD